MSEPKSTLKSKTPDKKERLRQALRANLQKRKQAVRKQAVREQGHKSSETDNG